MKILGTLENRLKRGFKMQQASNIAHLPRTEDLSKLLECPVCCEIPFPPIYNCNKGHIICPICHPRLKNCPQCSAAFSTSRNYAVESIVNMSTFQCNYKSNGCTELIKGEKFQQHLKTCAFRNGKVKEVPASTSEGSQRTGCSNANEASSSSSRVRIGGCCWWKSSSANDQIPLDAVDGGIEHGSRLYVARAPHSSGLFPGKLHSQSRNLLFPLGGRERIKNEYEVLIAEPGTLRWDDSKEGKLPSNAVIGGRTDIGEALYIGRCGHIGTLVVGWVLPSKKSLKISYQGMEYDYPRYEVLVKTGLGIAIDSQSSLN